MATDVIIVSYSIKRGVLTNQGVLLTEHDSDNYGHKDPTVTDKVLLYDGAAHDMKRLKLSEAGVLVNQTLVHLNAGPGDV